VQALGINNDEALVDARLLLQHVLNMNHAWLISHTDAALSFSQLANLDNLLQRRLQGEPMAYILEAREFYGLTLKTTPATLIPRPDTETLVETALVKLDANTPKRVLDLGTGTGAVALAIASVRPMAMMTATDLSAEAFVVAQDNAARLGLANVGFIQSDWLKALQGQCFDVIVSNPPYIAKEDVHLTQGDLRFEPLSALVSGEDGLEDIRMIIQQAPEHLNDQGWLLLEHGYDQASEVAQLLADANFSEISHALDLACIERVTLGCWQPNR
jgi:release factor glutamine methyltransferase